MRTAIANRELISRFLGKAENYNKAHAMYMRVFGNREDAEDGLHDLFLKLYNNAATISFPENPDEALAYLQRVIQNARNDAYDKAKHQPEKATDEEAWEVAEDEILSDAAKLEQVNDYVHEHGSIFTDDQVKLWDCIYDKRSIEETESILGKNSNNIYVMRFNLFAKIHRCMEHDGLL